METRPKILILGNGFDLAHYLPTSYTHFMKAMMALGKSEVDTEINFDTLFSEYIENDDWFIDKTKEVYRTDELILSVDIANELRAKLKTNGWFQHFKNHLTKIDTWIDFENEIEKVLLLFIQICDLNFEHNYIDVKNQATGKIFEKRRTAVAFNILNDNEQSLTSKFFNSFKNNEIHKDLLKNFNITHTYYIFIKWYELRDTTYHKVSEAEYNKTQEFERKPYDSTDRLTLKKLCFQSVINTKFLSYYNDNIITLKASEIFKKLSDDLDTFINIFELYISQAINKLEPKKQFEYKGDVLGHPIEAVFTFNYSNSFERFYPKCELNLFNFVQYLHGNADEKNTVLGITDLEDERLKRHKLYSFVKTYQKIINRTDYDFLQDTELFDRKERLANGEKLGSCYEIIIWGHSLDSSDAEYIKELFKLNNQRGPTNIQITVWYHDKPHDLLANLMHIMGKDIIQEWMKRRWLRVEPSLTI